MDRVVVKPDRCKACELCIDACPRKILRLSDRINKQGYNAVECIDQEHCTSCAICARMCPDTALAVYKPD